MRRMSNGSVCLAGFVVGFITTGILFSATVRKEYVSVKIRQRRHSKTVSMDINPLDHPGENSKNPGSRILCWILTQPLNFKNRSMSVKTTWTRSCDVILFFSSKYDPVLSTIILDIPEHRHNLPKKVFKALGYIHDNYYDQADWFLKADDDTYVILNNLRHFLKDKDTMAPYYYGQIFNATSPTPYASGGAGYVLGKHALRLIASMGWKSNGHVIKLQQSSSEDIVIGRCLASLGITPWKGTQDALGRHIFNWNNVYNNINNRIPDWARKLTDPKTGPGNVSTIVASFHYIHYAYMLSMDYFLYNLTVYGYQRPEWLPTQNQ